MDNNIDSRDIPQANSLEQIRKIVEAIFHGYIEAQLIERETGLQNRDISYSIHAGRTLNLLTGDGNKIKITALGAELVASARKSLKEHEVFRQAINNSPIIGTIFPRILDSTSLTKDDVTRRIMQFSSLNENTARRRASTIISWRRQLDGYVSKRRNTPKPEHKEGNASKAQSPIEAHDPRTIAKPIKQPSNSAIAVSTITDTQKSYLLSIEESHFLDLKSIEINPGKLTKTISAFANSSGGELYIGIQERSVDGKKQRSWKGFENQEAANGHVQVFEQLFPLGQSYAYAFLENPGQIGLVLHVNINKTREITKASDGTPYIRRGAQSLPVSTDEGIARLKLDKGIESFEKATIDAPLATITKSIPIARFLSYIVPSAEPEPWLSKQMLIREGKVTVAGVLLFSDEPQAILPKRCAVKIYRYGTTANEGTRETLVFNPLTIEGCLYEQIKAAVAKTKEIVEGIKKRGPKGLERIQYPDETLHEIITNAVLHRDYSIASDVHIRIFDNRVEIESPGQLPGHVTQENILREQFARNGAIVRIINKFPEPPNKDVGEGLRTAFSAMRKIRLKDPDINETENSVLVHIRHEPLASPEAAILKYLETHENIVNREARQATGINSENSVKRIFYKLRDMGLLEMIPGRDGFRAAWRKKKK